MIMILIDYMSKPIYESKPLNYELINFKPIFAVR